jgi:uncharacterized protein (TIGR03437 family)
MRSFSSQFSSPLARRRPHFAALEIAALILWFTAGSLPSRAASSTCLAPPSGLVSWWPGDTNNDDLAGLNNPNAAVGVTHVPGEVLDGFSLGKNGYLQVPASESLANPNFTWAAWVKPMGPGPNNDAYGSALIIQNGANDEYQIAVGLYWTAVTNQFTFVFGNIGTDQIISTDTYPAGSFYHVAGTYDGSVFRLYVNGVAEGSFTLAPPIGYTSNPWSIGSSGQIGISLDYPRTLNGVIDEVQAFDRALSQSELQAIYNAGSAGECKGKGESTGPSTPLEEIVNAASYANPIMANSGIAQGSIFTIFGKNIGPSNSPPIAFPLSTTLGGVTVSVSQGGGAPVNAIPLFVGPHQINAIMPSTAPLGTDSVMVTYQGQISTGSVQVVASSFGILTFNSSGSGQALSTNDSYQLVDYNLVAHPGEYLTLWGTGLGAISGSDANKPPTGNIPASNPIVYVGGRLVTPIYHGRSPCCGGVDQVIFALPANIIGCNVPVAVEIGNTMSNFVSVAVAPSGSATCTDPFGVPYSVLAAWGTQGSATLGNIVYEAYNDTAPSVLSIFGGGGTSVASGIEQIATFYKYQFTNLTDLAPILNLGACTVYTFTGTSAPPPGVYNSTGLDAGSPLTVTDGDEQGHIKESSSTGYYRDIYELPAGSVTFAGPGGNSVGAFNVTFPVGPQNLFWSNESGISTITRSSGVKVTWTGADPGSTVQITGYSIGGASTSTAAGAGFTCTADGGAGQFTVPASILQALPASADFSNSILPIATGSLGISSRGAPVPFSATGLDFGRAYTESEFSNTTVIYQ